MFEKILLCRGVLLCGAMALVFAGCGDDENEQVESTEVPPTTELPDPTGCDAGDEVCQAAFMEAYGCFPFNGRWDGRWRVDGGTLGGAIVANITMDGCQGGGTAVFDDAPCFSSAEIEAVAEGTSIGGRVVGEERGSPVDVNLSGEGGDSEINLTFDVVEGTFCAGLTGTIVLER